LRDLQLQLTCKRAGSDCTGVGTDYQLNAAVGLCLQGPLFKGRNSLIQNNENLFNVNQQDFGARKPETILRPGSCNDFNHHNQLCDRVMGMFGSGYNNIRKREWFGVGVRLIVRCIKVDFHIVLSRERNSWGLAGQSRTALHINLGALV